MKKNKKCLPFLSFIAPSSRTNSWEEKVLLHFLLYSLHFVVIYFQYLFFWVHSSSVLFCSFLVRRTKLERERLWLSPQETIPYYLSVCVDRPMITFLFPFLGKKGERESFFVVNWPERINNKMKSKSI